MQLEISHIGNLFNNVIVQYLQRDLKLSYTITGDAMNEYYRQVIILG